MLIKKEKNYSIYIKIGLLVIVIVLIFVFRNKFISSYIYLDQRYFQKSQPIDINQTEREELGRLRTENKVLKDENEKLKQEYFGDATSSQRTLVHMLLGESTLYGNFFVNLPKNKTPYIGMNIFSDGDVVVGQVSEILPTSLKVDKLGQNKTFIANSLENEESIELGSLGSGLYVGTVPGGSKISLGDTIVLKGYPKAVVGTVVEIGKGDSSLSSVYVRTPYNINNKEIFYVLQ
jgi:cell division protein FtsB